MVFTSLVKFPFLNARIATSPKCLLCSRYCRGKRSRGGKHTPLVFWGNIVVEGDASGGVVDGVWVLRVHGALSTCRFGRVLGFGMSCPALFRAGKYCSYCGS